MSEVAVQLTLLSSAEMPAVVFDELESRGVYTGARLRAQRPDVYQRCVALLQEGVSPLQIEAALRIEHRTVEAVAAAHAIPIQTTKKRMAERFRFAADRLLDLVHRTSDARDAKDFMIGASCATDKWQLLDGQPTSRNIDIEVSVTTQDLNAWIHSATDISDAKRGALLEAGSVPSLPPSDSESPAASLQPLGRQCAPLDMDCHATDLATATATETTDRGGGGLASYPPRPRPLDVSERENFPVKGPSFVPPSDSPVNAPNPLDP